MQSFSVLVVVSLNGSRISLERDNIFLEWKPALNAIANAMMLELLWTSYEPSNNTFDVLLRLSPVIFSPSMPGFPQ